MIGNDIVDLALAKEQSNWRRKGYLGKIFSSREQLAILNASDPDSLVWLFWTMKEAAYKIDNKITGVRNFAPAGLECELSSGSPQGINLVKIQDRVYHTQTEMNGSFIHTIAARYSKSLPRILISIYISEEVDYKKMAPDCVSHHGRYLALINLK